MKVTECYLMKSAAECLTRFPNDVVALETLLDEDEEKFILML